MEKVLGLRVNILLCENVVENQQEKKRVVLKGDKQGLNLQSNLMLMNDLQCYIWSVQHEF